jgi:oxygen-independent coproporphyrinogen-3 oxidase
MASNHTMSNLLGFAERNVPRYTSYPTAPHFSTAIGPVEYSQWISELRPDATLSLYIHVPYCTELCLYCGCTTKAVRRREPIEHYAEHVIEEISLLTALAGPKVVHLHWGGGTPSILGPKWLIEITTKLAASFDLSLLAEHAIELDPRQLDEALVRTLAAIGVTRASLGVQDFSAHVQRAIGRVQPFEAVAHSVDWLRAAGITDLSFDLMYGLPYQKVSDVARSAALAASLAPQRIALFGYAHVPWFRVQQRRIDAAALPGFAARLEQARVAAETLGAAGYIPIGLDHFAKPDDKLAIAARKGLLHRNFQGYTTDAADALIGLGASAIGRLPQGFVQNAPDVAGYTRAIAAKQLATVRGIRMSDDDRLRGAIIERLMCDLAVDLDRIAPNLSFEVEIALLEPLRQEGLLRIEARHIVVTEIGRPFVRLVAAAFDTYLATKPSRHSVAV